MQQHLGVIVILGALCVALLVLFVSKVLLRSRVSSPPSVGEQDIGVHQAQSFDDPIDDIVSIRRKAVVDPGGSLSKEDDNAVIDLTGMRPFSPTIVTLYVMAKPRQAFKGYELLQAILSQGLRYGEMSIFHRSRQENGRGSRLFSLASAMEPGTFDIHNMGGFECPGLILFFQTSSQTEQNAECFEAMYKAASSLAKELDGECWDDKKKPITDTILSDYRARFSTVEQVVERQCTA